MANEHVVIKKPGVDRSKGIGAPQNHVSRLCCDEGALRDHSRAGHWATAGAVTRLCWITVSSMARAGYSGHPDQPAPVPNRHQIKSTHPRNKQKGSHCPDKQTFKWMRDKATWPIQGQEGTVRKTDACTAFPQEGSLARHLHRDQDLRGNTYQYGQTNQDINWTWTTSWSKPNEGGTIWGVRGRLASYVSRARYGVEGGISTQGQSLWCHMLQLRRQP